MAGPGGRTVGRVSIQVLPDTSRFGEKLRADMAKIEKRVQLNIPVHLDTKGLATEARMAANRIKSMMDDIKVNPDVIPQLKGETRVRGQLATLTRPRDVEISVKLVKRSVTTLTSAIASLSGAQYLRGIIQHINTDTLQLVQVISALVPAILHAGSALAALIPAAAGAAAVIGGTLYLAFSNIDRTLPAFARVRDAMYSFGDAYEALETRVQRNFFQGLEKQIIPLGNTYLPLLTRGLGGVASALNTVAVQAAKGLLDPQVVRNTSTLIENTRQSLVNFAPAIQNIIRAFSDLAAVGSSFFPDMATNATNATARFREFISEARKSGQLKQFIGEGLEALKALGRTAKNAAVGVGNIMAAINRGGGGSIQQLEKATKAFADMTKSARAQGAIVALFSGLTAGIEQMTIGLRKAGPAIEGIFGLLGNVLQQVGTVVGTALGVLGKALEPLMPALNQLAGLLGGVITNALRTMEGPLTTVTTALGDFLAPLLPQLSEGFQQLQTALAPVVQALADGFAQALAAIAPHMPAMIDASIQLGLAFAKLLTAVAPLIGPLIQLVMAAFIPMVQVGIGVVNFISQLVTWFASLLGAITPVIAKVVEFVAGLADGSINVREKVGQMVTAVKNWLTGLVQKWTETSASVGVKIGQIVNWVKGLPGRVVGAIKKFGNDAKNTIQSAWNSAWNSVRNLVNRIVSWISTLPGKALAQLNRFKNNVVNAVRSAGSQAASLARSGFQRMVTAIQSKITSAVNTAKQLPGKIKSGLGNLGRLLFSAGQDIVRGLANGIRNMAGRATAAARDIANQVSSTIKGALQIGSPSKLMRQYGGWTSEGLALGIEGELTRVEQAANRMAAAAMPNLANVAPAGAQQAAVAASGPTINQTINAAPGMDEKNLANETMRRMAFAMRR